MTTVKRMIKLQKMKVDIMWDALTTISKILKEYYKDIPDEILSRIVVVYEKLLVLNERIDNAREKNISSFYSKLRNKYEGIYNMEVSNNEEKEED